MVDALAPSNNRAELQSFAVLLQSDVIVKVSQSQVTLRSWLFIASYFSIWVLTARCSHLGFICTKGVVIVSGGGRGPVRVKFWQATRPWNSDTWLDEMNKLVLPETRPTPQNAKWPYSGSSANGHSCKQKALLTATFTKCRFSQLPYKLGIFTFP